MEIPPLIPVKSFEDCYDEIRDAVYKRRPRWKYQLNAIDFDDIAQIIIHHIYKKWALYDQSLPLLNFVNAITTNQMINLARNYYNTYMPPCNSCACRLDENSCSLFGTQDKEKCGVLKKWFAANKQESYNINLAVSTENHTIELTNKVATNIDYGKIFEILQDRNKKILTNIEYSIFDLIFIQKIDESIVLKRLGYKFSKNKSQYNKQLEHIKDSIYKKIKKYLYSDECDITF